MAALQCFGTERGQREDGDKKMWYLQVGTTSGVVGAVQEGACKGWERSG